MTILYTKYIIFYIFKFKLKIKSSFDMNTYIFYALFLDYLAYNTKLKNYYLRIKIEELKVIYQNLIG